MRKLFCLGIICILGVAAHAAVIGKATVTADQAPVMSGKQVVATAKKGDTFDVTEVKGDWFGVAPSQGWIHKDSVRYIPSTSAESEPFQIKLEEDTLTVGARSKQLPERVLLWRKYYAEGNEWQAHGLSPSRSTFDFTKLTGKEWLATCLPVSLKEGNSLSLASTNGLAASAVIKGLVKMEIWLSLPGAPYARTSNVLTVQKKIQQRGGFVSGWTDDGFFLGGQIIGGKGIVGVYQTQDMKAIVPKIMAAKGMDLLGATKALMAPADQPGAEGMPEIEIRGTADSTAQH